MGIHFLSKLRCTRRVHVLGESSDAIVPCFIEQRMCSVILKGVPYWLGFGPFSEITRFGQAAWARNEFVVSFDMGKEVFRQVHVPYD
jgi:hypothetical protein